jgi:hypothetical protein
MNGFVAVSEITTKTERGVLATPCSREDRAAPLASLGAPSPNMVVAANWRRTIEAEEQARAREAVVHAEHAAEIVRLTQALREARVAHQADIDRLREEHAAELRRLVEALWRAQDVARAALDQRDRGKETTTPRSLTKLRPRSLGSLAAIMRGRHRFG